MLFYMHRHIQQELSERSRNLYLQIYSYSQIYLTSPAMSKHSRRGSLFLFVQFRNRCKFVPACCFFICIDTSSRHFQNGVGIYTRKYIISTTRRCPCPDLEQLEFGIVGKGILSNHCYLCTCRHIHSRQCPTTREGITLNAINGFEFRPFLERYGLQGGTTVEGEIFNRFYTCRNLDHG